MFDQALLSERYLVLQKSLHPDNFVTADAQEQRIAMQKSTEVNDALKTLKATGKSKNSEKDLSFIFLKRGNSHHNHKILSRSGCYI